MGCFVDKNKRGKNKNYNALHDTAVQGLQLNVGSPHSFTTTELRLPEPSKTAATVAATATVIAWVIAAGTVAASVAATWSVATIVTTA